MKKIKLLLIMILLINLSLFGNTVRLKEISRIKGVRSNKLIGMGLVIGLAGTGDQSELTPQMLQSLYAYFGTRIATSQIQSKNVAAVMLTAELPPFKKIGDTIDVNVSSINDAKSLEGGILLMTQLKGGMNQEIFANAQGSLTKVNNKTNNAVNGYIPNGAVVEKEIPIKLDTNDTIDLILNKPDFTTASRVATTVNKRFGYETAKAIDPSKIRINKTFTFHDDLISFISTIENLKVTPDRESIIVINERTGTIILGANIVVAPVAISQGDLSISISAQNDLNTTEDEKTGNSFYFEGVTVKEVVNMLNKIGAKSEDIISILQALKEANAIDAKIKIM